MTLYEDPMTPWLHVHPFILLARSLASSPIYMPGSCTVYQNLSLYVSRLLSSLSCYPTPAIALYMHKAYVSTLVRVAAQRLRPVDAQVLINARSQPPQQDARWAGCTFSADAESELATPYSFGVSMI